MGYFIVLTALFLLIGLFLLKLKEYDNDYKKVFLWIYSFKNKILSKMRRNNENIHVNNIEVNPKSDDLGSLKTNAAKTNAAKTFDKSINKTMPFDLNDLESLSYFDKELRKKVFDKLSKRPVYFVENNQRKIVVPLEAIAFLNNDFNPLVNEYGEIVVTIREEAKLAKNIENFQILIEDIEKSFKEELFKEDDEVIESLRDLIKIANKKGVSLKDIVNIVDKRKEEEVKEEEVKEEEVKEEEVKEEEVKEEEVKEDFIDMEDSFLDNISSEYDSQKDVLDDEMDSEIGSEVDNEKIEDFLSSLKWKYQQGARFDFKNIPSSLNEVLSTKDMFFNNLIKHKYIIFNDNKTAFFAPQVVVFSSIAKIYGNDYESTLLKMNKLLMRPDSIKLFNNTIIELLNDYLYDINNHKFFIKSYFKNKGNVYYGFGLWFSIDSIKMALNDDDSDFVRSFPLYSNYKVIDQQETDLNLVQDFQDIII